MVIGQAHEASIIHPEALLESRRRQLRADQPGNFLQSEPTCRVGCKPTIMNLSSNKFQYFLNLKLEFRSTTIEVKILSDIQATKIDFY